MVPSTETMLREGSFALASFGRFRKVQFPETALRGSVSVAGRWSVALKRILEAVLESLCLPAVARRLTRADFLDVLLAIVFTPSGRISI
jgi:hypothetical protein